MVDASPPTDSMLPSSPSSALTVRSDRALVAARTLDELDDEDALAIGRFFSQVPVSTTVSILGMSLGIGVAVATLGLGPVGIGVCGAVMAGGVAVGGRATTRSTLDLDLGLAAETSRWLFKATGDPRLAMWRAPRREEDVRAWGHRIIARARAMRGTVVESR